ncbi:F0F1 ATP synthase subunit B [Aliarcobacter thereius]|uniref:F0F1 ATP synthase subunit B family protein n=1 Tax=Aliarcobacter thereius TaxID=544718 RepID=UPI000828A039|nr:F0F1 ATP synthase subunit B [Aliarcobacter thereius]OCL87828.1 F0F1 ATP synthase subunit B [Aliarcobacter thereius]TLT08412.1 F0F1 ATP synthase subunit B [Aliarcobacter thereius]HJE03734.1 F0F1 ATP synthase subunit B [Aliarcobacter thereius]
MYKAILIVALAMLPVAIFANDGAETNYDIVQRTVNFIIFASIIWYLLANRIKAFFVGRTLGIQAELDKVQDTKKASEEKKLEAVKKSEDAKRISAEIIESAKADVDAIKQKVLVAVEAEIANLNKNFDEMMKVELSKVKKDVVASILDELLNSDTINLSQDELVDIVLKKVA